MDAVVTARVPVEVKEQVNKILRNMGSSPTELINAAYRYVLKSGALPDCGRQLLSDERGSRPRQLSNEQRTELMASLAAMTLPLPSNDTRPFKELLAEARDERYAHLS